MDRGVFLSTQRELFRGATAHERLRILKTMIRIERSVMHVPNEGITDLNSERLSFLA